MKRSSALLLQIATVLIGLATLTFLLWEPHVEGRNAHATVFEIYFHDPFLAYVYVGSTPFFMALFQAFKLFGQVRKHGAFSPGAVETLRTIKHCGLALIGFVAGAVVIILLFGDQDDRPAGFFLSFLAAFASTVIAATAAMFERKLQEALRCGQGPRR